MNERFPGCRVTALAGDASTRRFLRATPATGPAFIVMDYGRPFEGVTDDVTLSRLFLEAGLPVARVLEVHPEAGCLFLEDLGPDTLEDVLTRLDPRSAEGARRTIALYRDAARMAAEIARNGTVFLAASARAAGPALDSERFRFEMTYFVTNFVRGLLGFGGPAGDLAEALNVLADRAASSSQRVLCHRDFHSRNLMVRTDGSLAMVDIQDARWGPDTYDLASLLYDAYADIPGGAFRAGAEEFCATAGLAEAQQALERRLDLVAAQRMIKALGTFGYQVSVLGKERYRPAIHRTVARLQRLLPAIAGCEPIDLAFDRLGVYRQSRS